jgi:hypothetical protein
MMFFIKRQIKRIAKALLRKAHLFRPINGTAMNLELFLIHCRLLLLPSHKWDGNEFGAISYSLPFGFSRRPNWST